jgi:hypothetical protein
MTLRSSRGTTVRGLILHLRSWRSSREAFWLSVLLAPFIYSLADGFA